MILILQKGASDHMDGDPYSTNNRMAGRLDFS